MLRLFNPADLVGLLVLQTRAPANLAYSQEAVTGGVTRALPLGSLLWEWLPGRNGRHTWVHSKRGMAVGVVSARSRRGHGSWEIDRLQVARGCKVFFREILEGLNWMFGRKGAERLSIRLAQDSPLHETILQAGFTSLVREELYLRPKSGPSDGGVPSVSGTLRLAQEADDFNLFRLYNAVVPSAVRQAEGLYLRDWRGVRDVSQTGAVEEALVVQHEEDVSGVATVSKGGNGTRIVDLLAHPSGQDIADALIAASIGAYGNKGGLMCLLPDYLCSVAPCLEKHGFQYCRGFQSYVRPVTARVKQPNLLPVGA